MIRYNGILATRQIRLAYISFTGIVVEDPFLTKRLSKDDFGHTLLH